MGYTETSTSWDYVGMTVYPLDENGQRITKTVGQDTVEVSYYLPSMGLYKVSNSNRQNDILVPTLKHTTVEVPGGDGMYWFGSQHTQKPIPVKFAYDNLKEEDLYTLRWLFDGKKHLHVIFDEYPYKYYDMVVSSAPQFDYVPFTEDRVIDGVQTPRRIFKGEGSVQLTSYLPYAIGIIKYWSATNESGEPTDPVQKTWANWHELQDTTNIPSHAFYTYWSIGNWINGTEGRYMLWNGGDMPCNFKINLPINISASVRSIYLYYTSSGPTAVFEMKESLDPGTFTVGTVTFDTRLHLVYDESGQLLNKYLNSEGFVPIPTCSIASPWPPFLVMYDWNGTRIDGTYDYASTITVEYDYKFY